MALRSWILSVGCRTIFWSRSRRPRREEPSHLAAMGIDSQGRPVSDHSETIGEAAILLIAIGSLLLIVSAASILYALHRRRRHTSEGESPLSDETAHSPTDYMKSLATWDRSTDEILEKRRKAMWTLEMFENYGTNDLEAKNRSFQIS